MKSLLKILCLLSALTLGAFADEAPIYSAEEVDVKPVPQRAPAPEYPPQLLAKEVTGVVSVAITIDEKGIVRNCEVIKSTNPDFSTAATKAVRRWRFAPATKGGAAVSCKVTLPIHFRLE